MAKWIDREEKDTLVKNMLERSRGKKKNKTPIKQSYMDMYDKNETQNERDQRDWKLTDRPVKHMAEEMYHAANKARRGIAAVSRAKDVISVNTHNGLNWMKRDMAKREFVTKEEAFKRSFKRRLEAERQTAQRRKSKPSDRTRRMNEKKFNLDFQPGAKQYGTELKKREQRLNSSPYAGASNIIKSYEKKRRKYDED